MKEKVCGVTGHREIPAEYMEQAEQGLRREIEKAIADGYTYFISGGHAGGMYEGRGYQRRMGFQCLHEAQPLYGRPGGSGDRCL